MSSASRCELRMLPITGHVSLDSSGDERDERDRTASSAGVSHAADGLRHTIIACDSLSQPALPECQGRRQPAQWLGTKPLTREGAARKMAVWRGRLVF